MYHNCADDVYKISLYVT